MIWSDDIETNLGVLLNKFKINGSAFADCSHCNIETFPRFVEKCNAESLNSPPLLLKLNYLAFDAAD
jgi:hypothetical protein